MIKERVGIIGCGNMGEAIISRLSHIVPKGSLIIADADALRSQTLRDKYKVKTADSNNSLVAYSDIVILAVKPKDFEEVLNSVKKAFSEKKLLMSIAAGITTKYIERVIGKKIPVIRVMPNMPALIGEAVSSVSAGRFAKKEDLKTAEEIFSSIGYVVEVKEEMVDAVTALSGSGPAYFFYLVESLLAAAQELGVDEGVAKTIVFKTAFGSSKLLDTLNETPERLRARVTSKGGTTEAALRIFESRNFKGIVKEAVKEAYVRSKELSRR